MERLVLDERMTVGDWLTHWVDIVLATRVRERPTLAASTRDSYADAVRLHIRPSLGRHRLTKLGPEHIDNFIATKRPTYRANSLRIMRTTLRKALNDASEPDTSPATSSTSANRQRVATRSALPLGHEARTLLSSLEDHRLLALMSYC